MTYPSIHAIWAKWAPPLERSRLAAVAFSGSYVGTVIALPLSGLLAENLSWESIFYVFGQLRFKQPLSFVSNNSFFYQAWSGCCGASPGGGW